MTEEYWYESREGIYSEIIESRLGGLRTFLKDSRAALFD